MKTYVYIVNTSKGACKMTTHAPIDLIQAEKNLHKMGEFVTVTNIYELNFFEKLVDKIRNKQYNIIRKRGDQDVQEESFNSCTVR